ncbi:hypothetical protein FEM03_10305 [Phragmitibacter flavus]|uniref:Verru_Chthon cassette protein A n=1 Tax=Phragmitibacter flavus TaxID=2576071 RepID=A0A5R8KEF4_9BACT|nr:hypothetical protein [Phragmitibacter flavus]TLD70696.1 hypothetical protein FEM03_10305 [Phragmitibacter flavus]
MKFKRDGFLSGRCGGAALIMTVILLALITVMVMGFANLVRNETASASSHQGRGRALLFAQMGTDMVTSTLRNLTADPSLTWASRPGALITALPEHPTKLVVQTDLHSGMPSARLLDVTSDVKEIFRPANLNVSTLHDNGSHLITDQSLAGGSSPISLPLRWVYLRQDGSVDFAEEPDLTDEDNPVTGRFAYWADDESSKVNINTAWKRNAPGDSNTAENYNSFFPTHPSGVDLASVFAEADSSLDAEAARLKADFLHAYITPNHRYTDMAGSAGRFFNDLSEMRRLDHLPGSPGGFATALSNSKFQLTHYNHDPDTTFFNEPRFVLTTQEKYAPRNPDGTLMRDANGVPYFLDILNVANSDPGEASSQNLSRVKLDKTIRKLITYLQRVDWPMTSNETASLQSKYYPGTNELRLTQLALNILEYVRSAESSLDLVEPIRGIIDLPGTYGTPGAFVANAHVSGVINVGSGVANIYKGSTRNLFITEVSAWVGDTPVVRGGNNYWPCELFCEIHLPKHGGLEQINLADVDGKMVSVGFSTYLKSPGEFFSPDTFATFTGKYIPCHATTIMGGNTMIGAGEYRVVRLKTVIRINNRPTTMPLRLGLALGPKLTPSQVATEGVPDPGSVVNHARRLELVPVGQTFTMTLDGASVSPESIRSYEVTEYNVNSVARSWTHDENGVLLPRLDHSFGNVNQRTLGILGKEASSLTFLPTGAPELDVDKDGKLTDVGLRMPYPKGHAKNPHGIVYSAGELGFIHTGIESNRNATTGGVPFRTLRLQPSRHDTSVVPDWAFMDLFSAPVVVPNAVRTVFAPNDSAVAGRVNVNALVEPYADVTRHPQLAGSLERNLPLIALLAGVPNPSETDEDRLLTTEQARTIAENIYFRRLASGGKNYGYAGAYDSPGEIAEIEGVADQGELSESVLRGIASLVTTRGSVISIYTIGQSLQQTRSRELMVTGEQRQRTMLEALRELDPTTGLATQVRFRKVGHNDLYP